MPLKTKQSACVPETGARSAASALNHLSEGTTGASATTAPSGPSEMCHEHTFRVSSYLCLEQLLCPLEGKILVACLGTVAQVLYEEAC